MIQLKRALLRCFFGFEIVLFIWTYIFGAHGLYALMQMKKSNQAYINALHTLRSENDEVQRSLDQWHSHPFYKEKRARELLQMARKHDEIFYLS